MAEKIINNRYEILKEIGRGAMGMIYLVKDRMNGRELALKMLNERLVDLKGEESFKVEFELMSRLLHPNLLRVYDFGETGDNYFITMEYARNDSLETLIKNNTTFNIDETLVIMLDLLRAVEFIHSRKILHRDIKPGNILLGDKNNRGYEVKLMDFGLANPEDAMVKRPRGTLSYMAPEIITGDVSYAIDIFSLGVTFYELVSNKVYYHRLDTSHIYSTLNSEASFNTYQHKIFDDIDDSPFAPVILKMTAFQKEDRYINCIDIIEDLNDIFHQDLRIESETTRSAYVLGASFIGRDAELNLLKKVPGSEMIQACLIHGVAGIGKTRLVQEFKRYCQLNGTTFITASCTEDYTRLFDPFITILTYCLTIAPGSLIETYGKTLKKILPENKELAGIEAGEVEKPAAERRNIAEAIVLFILGVVSDFEKSLIFYISDIHWMDEASTEVINELIGLLITMNLPHFKIIVSGRDQGVSNIQVDTFGKNLLKISLKPFNSNAIKDYLTAVFGSDRMTKELVNASQFLQERVGGNPLFLQELVRSMVEDKIIRRKSYKWDLAGNLSDSHIPGTLTSVLGLRFKNMNLTDEEKEILSLMALLNRPATIDELVRIVSFSYEALMDLVDREICRKDIESFQCYYSVNHTLIREFIVTQIERRKEYHKLIANKLESIHQLSLTGYIEELAYHYSESDARDKAILYLEKAAVIAKNNNAARKALELYDKLLAYIDENDIRALCDIYINQGVLFIQLGDWDDAKGLFDKALGLAERIGENDYLARAHYFMGALYQSMYKAAESIKSFTSAASYYTKLGNSGRLLECYSLIGVNYASHFHDYKKSFEYLDKANELTDMTDNLVYILTFYSNAGITYMKYGDYPKAITYLHQGLKTAEMLKMRLSVSLNTGYLGESYMKAGTFNEALFYLDHSIKIAQELEAKEYIAYFGAIKAELLFRMSKVKEAFLLNEEILELSIELNSLDSILPCRLLKYKIEYLESRHNVVVKKIETLLDDASNDDERGLICYEIWKLTGRGAYRQKALNFYKKLYEESKTRAFKMLVEELSGDSD